MKKDTTILNLVSQMLEKNNCDMSDYYQREYSKLKNLEVITIRVSDFEGNSTKCHSLSLESLIQIVELLKRQAKGSTYE